LIGGVEKGIDMLLRTDLARRTNMRCFNSYRIRDARRPLHARLRYQLGMLRSFRRELKRRPVGLIHVKTSSGINFHQNALYALAARWSGLPVLLQIHAGRFEVFYQESSPLVRAWIRHTLARVDAVAVLSRRWADRIALMAPAARLVVIPNGLEPAEMASLSQAGEKRPERVLFVGTGDPELNRDKGLEDLLEVLPAMLVRCPASNWVLAGLHDPMAVRDRLERSMGPGTQLGERVEFLPCVAGDARVSLFRESSILVLPSYYENMPNILLEAMAAGMGVAASNVGSIPEMLGPPEGGLLFEAGDREGLRSALERLLGAPSLVREQGRRNLVTVTREYALSVVERKLEGIYMEVGAERRPRRLPYRNLAATGGGETPPPSA
jgi:glycosyltransferase involved in cell wall biosynthesis